MYKLKEKRVLGNMFDYIIFHDHDEIGIININALDEYIFIRQIHIFDNYKRKGHARNIVAYLLKDYKKNIRFCIATNSNSAISFWNKILEEKEHCHIRGDIYELIYN